MQNSLMTDGILTLFFGKPRQFQFDGTRTSFNAFTATCVLVIALMTAVLGFSPTRAYADAGLSFTTATGVTEGSEHPIGTSLLFTVLSEPDGDTPGTVQVGNGSSLALDSSYSGAIRIPELVSNDASQYTVVSCAKYSFRLSKLTAAILPSTLIRVRSYAFYCCYDLQKVDFQGEPHINYIESHAFEVPSATGVLTDVRFPASLLSIGSYAFSGQSALSKLAFEGESLYRIGEFAFANCGGLKEARIPKLTAATSSFGSYCFSGCTNLAFVEFCSEVASTTEEATGTRFFDECEKLETVVYRGKKVVPSWRRYGSSTELAYEFTASNPKLYYTITYYGSRADAEAANNPIGTVCVRSDTPLCDIKPDMRRTDDSGAVVFDGTALAPLAGFDAWAYEDNPVSTDAPSDSLYAYPVSSNGIESASAVLDADAYPFTGKAVMPSPVVRDAQGTTLELDTDYTLSYERKGADETWAGDANCIEPGDMRVVVTGTGTYSGQVTASYTIAHAQAGDTFTSNGVTYVITEPSDGQTPGEASVGDGTTLAVLPDTQGTLEIPAAVNPDDSLVAYRVTAMNSYAFGSTSAEGACANLESVTLPEGINSLGTYAFGYCSNLTSMTIPASVRDIGARAFQNCIRLADLRFAGDEVDRLSAYCFAFCTSLTHVELPSATVFRENAFSNCTRLIRVDFLGPIEQAGTTQFSGCTRLARVVFHTADIWPGSFIASEPAFYGLATFKNAVGAECGRAILKVGTPLSSITPTIEKSYLLEGEVPEVPKGFGRWAVDGSDTEDAESFEGTCSFIPFGEPAEPDEPTVVPTDSDKPTEPEKTETADRQTADVVQQSLQERQTVLGGSGTSKAIYRVISTDSFSVSYAASQATGKKATVPASVTLDGVTYKVVKVDKNAFAGTKVQTVTIKSKSLTSLRKAFSSSKVKKVIAPKAQKKAYRKLLAKKACGKTVKVTWK